MTLDRERLWTVIDEERTYLADLLADLADDEWTQPSLCAGWTVRDVAAHLTLQQLGFADLPGFLRRWRGSMNRTIQHVARVKAAEVPTDHLIAEIRAMVGSRRYSLGVTPLESLIDVLVHIQDIAIPLGRHHDMPPDAAAVAATRTLSMRWPPPLPAVRKLAGLRLTATDTDWSAGSGPEVAGPMSALLLLSTGRLAALPRVTGDGVAILADRFSATAPA